MMNKKGDSATLSLGETRELMATMKELMLLLSGVEAKTQKINSDMPQTNRSLGTFRQLERVALRYLAISQRLGLPDNINSGMQQLSKLIVMIEMVDMSLNMFMRSTPFGWAMGAASLIMTGLSATDFSMNTG
jgi:hypothetical protein